MRRFPFSMDKYFLGSFCLCWMERESGERHEVVSKTEKPFLMETEFAVLKKNCCLDENWRQVFFKK